MERSGGRSPWRTVTLIVALPERPVLSVTVRVIRWDPAGSLTTTTEAAPKLPLTLERHAKVSVSRGLRSYELRPLKVMLSSSVKVSVPFGDEMTATGAYCACATWTATDALTLCPWPSSTNTVMVWSPAASGDPKDTEP